MTPATKTQRKSPADRGEHISLMEPLRLAEGSRHRPALTDLALDLVARNAGFRRSLPPSIVAALADLVRAMNCYYSNLIEGHDTHPVDIERALRGDYSRNPEKRDLQREAAAHIAVQRWIDEGGLPGHAVTEASIRLIHERFCAALPHDMLVVTDPATGEKVVVEPGQLRQRDVAVGRHIPVSAPAVPRFLQRYEEVYANLGVAESLLALGAAHHRLVWIHPFVDGNGRVARLVSHATLLQCLDTGGVWSVARGLARAVTEYKGHLSACDQRRRNDLDGRGNLSEEALAAFTRFFLATCIDQVAFMESLMQPAQLRARIALWAEEQMRLGKLPARANAVLDAVLYQGELPRAAVAGIVGAGERQSRRVVAALIAAGVLRAATSRAPLQLAFPAALAARWLPGLFPEQPAR